MVEKKLNLGCGENRQEGYIGVDKFKTPVVDVEWDLEQYPYPFADGTIDEIFTSHYIEHHHDIRKFMNECWRILKSRGKMIIVAPYWSSVRATQDPTHVNFISESTFIYYNKAWREANRLDHYLEIKADFEFPFTAIEYVIDPLWLSRNREAQEFAMKYYVNVIQDIKITLTKR